MQLPAFEQAYLLQSIGWAIANSFWQTGILWLMYQGIISIDKKMPALVKYHLSLVMLLSSFAWFILTIVKNYGLIKNIPLPVDTFLYQEIMVGLKAVNSLLPLLSIVYLVFLCFYLIRYIRNLSANRFLQTNGLTKAPIDFRLFITYTAIDLGIKKKIQVWLSEHVDVPSVTGFIKPVILLPAAMVNQLSVQQIEAILLHELAHIKRNDYLVNLLQSIVELILFFNPFALLLSETAKKEREYCCDDWVINFKYNQHDYAKALLILEEQRQLQPLTFALAATNGKKNLLLRIKRLFKTAPQTSISTSHQLKLTLLTLLLLIGIFAFFPFFTHKQAIMAKPLRNDANKKTAKINLDNAGNQVKEYYSGTILKSPLIKPISPNKPLPGKKITKKQPADNHGEQYVNAFINEELLNPSSEPETLTHFQVVDKVNEQSNYIVKIEEQQSGKNEITTYYLELNNQDGATDIKPLIIFNKEKVKRKVSKNIADSSVSTKKPVGKKKRITS